jgi:hypothetical protein
MAEPAPPLGRRSSLLARQHRPSSSADRSFTSSPSIQPSPQSCSVRSLASPPRLSGRPPSSPPAPSHSARLPRSVRPRLPPLWSALPCRPVPGSERQGRRHQLEQPRLTPCVLLHHPQACASRRTRAKPTTSSTPATRSSSTTPPTCSRSRCVVSPYRFLVGSAREAERHSSKTPARANPRHPLSCQLGERAPIGPGQALKGAALPRHSSPTFPWAGVRAGRLAGRGLRRRERAFG